MNTPLLDELLKSSDESFEKILITMMDKSNITMKTEIKKPKVLAQLWLLGKWLEIEGFAEASQMIFKFIDTYLEYMVSYNRQARKEVIQALSEMFKRERTVGERMLGTGVQKV